MNNDLIRRSFLLKGLELSIDNMRRIAGNDKKINRAIDLVQSARDFAAAQPAVKAVEVVHCEECKNFGRNLENETYCKAVGGLTDPEENDFCSYGERRGEE